MLPRHERVPTVGLLLAALGVVARGVEASQQVRLFNDAPRFIAAAQALAGGDWRVAVADAFHPLTALFMAATAHALRVDLEFAGQLVSVAAGGVGTFATWRLARAIYGDRVALAAALVFALHPRLVASSAGVQSDGLYLALFVLATGAAWRALAEDRLGSAGLAGLLCGLAYLTRPEGLVVAVALGLWILGRALRTPRKALRAAALGACFAAFLGAVGAPYVVALHDVTGSWSLTRKKTLWLEVRSAPPACIRSIADASRGEHLATARATPPGVLASTTGREATSLGASEHRGFAQTDGIRRVALEPRRAPPRAASPPDGRPKDPAVAGAVELIVDFVRALHGVVLALCLLGVGRARAPAGAKFLLTLCGVIAVMLGALYAEAGYVSRRHWLPAVALLMPFAGRGGLRLLDAVVAWAPPLARWPHARRALVAACVLVLLGDAAVPSEDAQKRARREAAQWLRDRAEAPVVASHRARDAYYAGASRYVPLAGTLPGDRSSLASARAAGAVYALVDVGAGDPLSLPAEWARELFRAEHRGRAVVVVEIAPP